MLKPNLLPNELGTTPVLGSASMPSHLAKAFQSACANIARRHREHQRRTVLRISKRAQRVSAAEVIEGVNKRKGVAA